MLQLPQQGARPKSGWSRTFIRSTASREKSAVFPMESATRMQAVGAHEIIIHSPDHNQSFARMGDDQIERVLQAYQMRILDLKRDQRFK